MARGAVVACVVVVGGGGGAATVVALHGVPSCRGRNEEKEDCFVLLVPVVSSKDRPKPEKSAKRTRTRDTTAKTKRMKGYLGTMRMESTMVWESD